MIVQLYDANISFINSTTLLVSYKNNISEEIMKIPFESLSPAMQSLVLFVKKYNCRESAKTFLESLCRKTSSCKNKQDYTLTIQFLSLDT